MNREATTRGSPEITVAWQSGAPTLIGLECFERGIAMMNKYAKAGQHIGHTIQTNGTKLGDDWCAFLKRNNFLVGLSVDGLRELHHVFHLDKNGEGTSTESCAAGVSR